VLSLSRVTRVTVAIGPKGEKPRSFAVERPKEPGACWGGEREDG